jgi:hypothetical protein
MMASSAVCMDTMNSSPVSLIPTECAALLARLRDEGGHFTGTDGHADRLFGPVAVRIAEQRGLIERVYGKYWGQGEEIRLTNKGRRAVGLAPVPLLSRIARTFRRPAPKG